MEGRKMRRTKVLCTIGPASRDGEILRRLVRAGMDVARLNLSHGDVESHRENVKRIRRAAEAERRIVAILVDLQGPKFRLGEIVESGVAVQKGDEVTLTTRDVLGETPRALPVQNDNFPGLVKKDDQVLIDDGLIELSVRSTNEQNVHCEVISGGTIKTNKGINLPGVSAELPSLTDKDRDDLTHALEWDVDWIALSFVRSAEDVKVLKRLIKDRTDRPLPVMAKIEKPEALENIDEIVEAADAIMVARGDLGIEIPTEKVPMAQKRIIELCNRNGIPAVTATQMLDSMIRNSRPTRAEASDVANAILDGTDAVMLSGETTIGQYPVESLETVVKIIHEVETARQDELVRPFRPQDESINLSIARAVGRAARDIADNLDIAGIIAITSSGYTARIVSRYRPSVRIFAVTPEVRVQRQLQLYWGVTSLPLSISQNTDEMIKHAIETVREHGYVKEGDLVAITAGTAGSEPGTTNLIQVHVIET
jgi:pyruvate kinase